MRVGSLEKKRAELLWNHENACVFRCIFHYRVTESIAVVDVVEDCSYIYGIADEILLFYAYRMHEFSRHAYIMSFYSVIF